MNVICPPEADPRLTDGQVPSAEKFEIIIWLPDISLVP